METTIRYQIRQLTKKDVLPFDLLLLADETIAAIETYIHDSDSYVVNATDDVQPIAVFVLYRLNDEEVEIKNIAVARKYQRRGIGSWLLTEIKQRVQAVGYRYVWVGTADAGDRQQQFLKTTLIRFMKMEGD